MPRPTAIDSASEAAGNGRRDPAAVLAASTFAAGLLLLPEFLIADARRLYLLLRTIDDLVDEEDPRAGPRVKAIEDWADGRSTDTPETRTLAELSRRYPLSPEAFTDFCKGMREDMDGAAVETEADLERYCGYAGGTVGVMLAGLLGTLDPEGERKMAVLGTAMQRTNILRDIDEDLERGRVYIARSTIRRFGFPHPGAREALVRDQIRRADALFADGARAIPLLRHGRQAMGLSAALYQEILRQIERDGLGRTAGRSRVPDWRKRQLGADYGLVLP